MNFLQSLTYVFKFVTPIIHKDIIHSCPEIYLATDDKDVITFYKTQGLQIKNFVTFPDTPNKPLHMSKVDANIKFTDMLCDLYLISMSETIMSNSRGMFIRLARQCWNDKHNFCKQFE